MKVGLYDSGLGGLSVLNEMIRCYPDAEYVYFGDSARAPYGEKSEEELTKYVYEIFDFMQDQNVDCVISACNTSSMFLHKMDLSQYSFKVISLFDVMKEFFDKSIADCSVCTRYEYRTQIKPETKLALLATPSNIDMKRYEDWGLNIHPLKCPKLVPLVESGNLEEAKKEFENYLSELADDIENVIVGCTHYSFLTPEKSRFEFIDPARVLVWSEAVDQLFSAERPEGSGPVIEAESVPELYCSGDIVKFKTIAEKLLANYQAEYFQLSLGTKPKLSLVK